MDRRTFATGVFVGVMTAPVSTRSQSRTLARIGWVGWYSRSAANGLFEAFRQGMRDLGYVEGHTVTIDTRWMEGTAPEEAARLSAELVRSKVDVLVAQGHAVLGAKVEARSVPIVFIYSGDPVAAQIVPNLGRPGGNLTGITLQAVDLAGKRIELLKEAAPRVSRLAAFVNPLHPGEDDKFRASEVATHRLGLTLRQFSVRTVADVNAALAAMPRDHVDGVVAFSSALIMSQRNGIAEFVARNRIPTISSWEDFAVEPHDLWSHPSGLRAPRGHVRRQGSEGCEAGRSPRGAAENAPAGHQPQDRQGTRTHHPALAAAPSGPSRGVIATKHR
jgi:putative tryptophan/tyrosine transport system substrate-binding protein